MSTINGQGYVRGIVFVGDQRFMRAEIGVELPVSSGFFVAIEVLAADLVCDPVGKFGFGIVQEGIDGALNRRAGNAFACWATLQAMRVAFFVRMRRWPDICAINERESAAQNQPGTAPVS